MSEFLRLLVAFLAAVNPPAAALALGRGPGLPSGVRERVGVVFVGVAVAALLFAAAAIGADKALDALDIAPESFRVAAGIVMASMGVLTLWLGRTPSEEPPTDWTAGIFPLGLPLLAGPGGLVAAISYGADKGEGKTLAAAAVALAVAAAVAVPGVERLRRAADAFARLLAALLVVVAAGLVVTGVRDI